MVDSDCPAPEQDKVKEMNDKKKITAAKNSMRVKKMLIAKQKEISDCSGMATANRKDSTGPKLEPALGMSMHPVIAASMRDVKNKPELVKFLREDRERLNKIFGAI